MCLIPLTLMVLWLNFLRFCHMLSGLWMRLKLWSRKCWAKPASQFKRNLKIDHCWEIMYAFHAKSFLKLTLYNFEYQVRKKKKFSELRVWLHWGMCLAGCVYLYEEGKKISLVLIRVPHEPYQKTKLSCIGQCKIRTEFYCYYCLGSFLQELL